MEDIVQSVIYPMIVERKQLLIPWALRNLRPKNLILSDATYFIPTEELIKNIIYPKFLIWIDTLNLSKWKHDWDCDNFADAFKLFSCGYYANNIDCEAEGIAIGVVNYIGTRVEDGSKGGHAANIFYIKNEINPQSLDIKFIEPQNGVIYSPTDEEFNTTWTIYL